MNKKTKLLHCYWNAKVLLRSKGVSVSLQILSKLSKTVSFVNSIFSLSTTEIIHIHVTDIWFVGYM